MEKEIKVSGMHCKSCSILLKDVVSEIKGVEVVSSDFEKGIIKVKFSGDKFWEIKKAIEKEGYKVIE
jgi:copper chaperone CopZ